MIKVVNVSKDYLEYVLTRLRKVDELEMISDFGEQYFDYLMKECLTSEIKIMLDEKGFPIGLFGIREINSDTAEICLLVTDDFKYHFKSFIKQSRKYFISWMKKYKRLENLIYKHNKITLKWLKKMGFRLIDYDEDRIYFFMERF